MRGRYVVVGLWLVGCEGRVALETSAEDGGAASGGAAMGGEASGGESSGGASTGGDGGDRGDGGSDTGQAPQWRTASHDPFGCAAHTATALDDDRALLVGDCGDTRGHLDALVYDASTESYREIVMPEPRTEHAAIRMMDGRVALVGGGYVLLVSPDSGNVEWGGGLLEARTYPALALLPDGRIWVIGGYGPNFEPLASTEILDTSAGTALAGPPLRQPRVAASALSLGDGRVWIMGDATSTATGTEIAGCAGCPLAQGPAFEPPEGDYPAGGVVLGGAAVVLGSGSSAWLEEGDTLSTPITHEQSFFFPSMASQGDERAWAAGISLWSGELHVFSAAPGERFELYATRFGTGGGASITVLGNRALLVSGDATLLDLPD